MRKMKKKACLGLSLFSKLRILEICNTGINYSLWSRLAHKFLTGPEICVYVVAFLPYILFVSCFHSYSLDIVYIIKLSKLPMLMY